MSEEGLDADFLHGLVFKPEISKDRPVFFVDHHLVKKGRYVGREYIALTPEVHQDGGEAVCEVRSTQEHRIQAYSFR